MVDEFMRMLDILMNLDVVVDIDFYEHGGGWYSAPSGYEEEENWELEQINIQEAWDYTTGSPSVTVGVLDSGVNLPNPALNAAHNASLVYGVEPYEDTIPHGTYVTSIMFANSPTAGFFGVCYNAKFASLKGSVNTAEYPKAKERYDMVKACIEHADDMGIPILNFSGGFVVGSSSIPGQISPEHISELRQVIADYDGLLVVGAGNDTMDLDDPNGAKFYPQCFDLPNMIVVGGSNSSKQLYYESNYGETSVDLFAPGQGVRAIGNTGYFTVGGLNGTSFSSPYVAGVAALLLSYDPSLTPAQIKEIIMSTVTEVAAFEDLCVSGGLLNAGAALASICRHDQGGTTTLIDSSTHNEECSLCGEVFVKPHNYTYYHNNSLTHSSICSCGHVGVSYQNHFFVFAGLEGTMQKMECSMCGYTKLVSIDTPIIKPNDILEDLKE